MNEFNNKQIQHLIQQVGDLKVIVHKLTHQNQELRQTINDMRRRQTDDTEVIDELCLRALNGSFSSKSLSRLIHRVKGLISHSDFVEQRIDNLEMNVFQTLPASLQQMHNIVGEANQNIDTDKLDRRRKKH